MERPTTSPKGSKTTASSSGSLRVRSGLCRYIAGMITEATVVGALLGCVELPIQAQAKEQARVEFRVLDEQGDTLPYRISEFVVTADRLPDHAIISRGLVVEGAPYGEYFYRLQRSDFPQLGQITGTLKVEMRTVGKTVVYHGGPIVSVLGHPGQGDRKTPKGITIRGLIRNRSGCDGKCWVRFQRLYEPDGYDVPVDGRGEFQLDQFLSGNYLLLVFEDGVLRHSVPITFRIGAVPPSPIIIDLPVRGPETMVVQ